MLPKKEGTSILGTLPAYCKGQHKHAIWNIERHKRVGLVKISENKYAFLLSWSLYWRYYVRMSDR